ncbi:MAG: plastocyanin/azurin family copper-binding protein [Candidatus Nitrosopumilus sp. bin_6a]
MRNSYFVLLVVGFSLLFGANSAFADHSEVTINTASGSGAPGCEATSSGCYSPSTATVDVGGVVIMTNTDSAAHTYTSGTPDGGPDGVFDTSLLMVGGSYEWSPETVGEQPYFCMVHPWMVGLIIVQESSSSYTPTPKPTPAPAPTYSIPRGTDVTVAKGSGVPGCENSNSCYTPYRFTTTVGKEVDWFNADSAAHTVTSGTPNGGPDGIFDSSLFMGGGTFSVTFRDAGTYDYFCMVHPWMVGQVLVKEIPTQTPTPTPTPIPTTPGTISVSTDDYQYSPNDLVTVKVSTSKSANVAVSVIGPGGDSIVSRSVSTDSQGNGSLQFKLPDSSQSGSYRVDTTATISGSKVSDSTTFTVKSNSARIDIISLQPTDQQGNAVSSFTKGKLGFVKVVLNSDSNTNSLVTINLFDLELTSLGIGSFKTTLGSGQSEMTLSFFIPNDASTGSGDIYANVFSDWPSQGGVPLTGESSTMVRIQ